MATAAAQHPFGGWFGTLGGIVGFAYGSAVSDGEPAAAFGVMLLGAVLGLAIEHAIFRVVMVGLAIGGVVIRDQVFSSIMFMITGG